MCDHVYLVVMDWSKCIICGKAGGNLRCPLDSLQKNGQEVYEKFLQLFQQFKELHAIPVDVSMPMDFEVTSELLVKNRAKWHKPCHLKFNSSKLLRAQNQKGIGVKQCPESPPDEQRRSKRGTPNKEACIFCRDESGKMYRCSTMELDRELRKMATKLQDASLLSVISGGDTTEESILKARVFAELVSYIEGKVDSGTYIFKLSELHNLYENRLRNLGIEKNINKTRLKTQILGHFLAECQEQSDGRNTLLVFNEGMKRLLKDSFDSRDFESEALLISKVAKILRKEIFQKKSFGFTGKFPPNCQDNSVPTLLKSLIAMLICGQCVQNEDATESQACLTISQLVYFNAKNSKSHEIPRTRHSKDREPPLPVFVGLQIHTLTRSKNLLQSMFRLGLSISYNRVIELENCLASAVCTQFEHEGIVCPANLRKGLFTVGALDNIDHNPSSTTAQGSFHGTGISIFQFPTAANLGLNREPAIISPETSGKYSLPEDYTNVPAVACQTNSLAIPEYNPIHSFEGQLSHAKKEENTWINNSMQLLSKHTNEKDDFISWAAFHASLQHDPVNPPALISLLPLFYDKAATLSMIKHGMDIQKKITNHLNPGQIPVTVFDQPLYALAKFVQWQWPETHGEKEFVVMFGGLHIEMALWNTIGDFLEGSGWTEALSNSGIASSGRADSFLKAAHLTRTRHGHQVTLLALAKLQHEAWENFVTSSSEAVEVSFEAWRQNLLSKSPTFLCWEKIMEFEMLVLIFICAHRTKNFSLYVESLENLVPWFFALDHTNYARWIPIHIRDMRSLPDGVLEELSSCWVLQKTQNVFSCMPLDQAHEQNNKLVKGSGGAVGLTENPTAFRRWMIAGP